MSELLRTFVAVEVRLPLELLDVTKSLAAMGWPVVAVRPDKLHVTLKFLGETPSELCEDVQRQVVSTVAGQQAMNFRVQGLGAFPTPQRPSVIWAGLLEAAPLVAVAERLEAALEPLGFARESRPFHPHLTLARIKARPPRELFDLLQRHAQTPFGNIDVRSIEFIQSDRQRDGAHYTTLASFSLG